MNFGRRGRRTIMNTPMIVTPWPGLIALIESEDFYSDVAIASSTEAYFRRLRSHPITKQLTNAVLSDLEIAVAVFKYADQIARSTTGSIRSEKDAALCACVVALSETAVPRFDDLLRFLRSAKPIALRWPSELADLVSSRRSTT